MGKKRKEKAAAAPPPDADPVTRSIAVNGQVVVVATGRRWRAVDAGTGQQLHSDATHDGAVRGVSLSPDGRHLLTCSDDKTARVWSTQDWSCSRVFKAPKKASACTFSSDGNHIFFADRFGDVLVATTAPAAAAATEAGSSAAGPVPEVPGVLLGHLQAIISSLSLASSSSGQQLIVSTDRDGKVRCSVLPDDPTKGSCEIQSYCLGHLAFVACSAAVPAAAGGGGRHRILTGSGDGTVRLWDADNGKQLACYQASEPPAAPAEEDAAGAAEQQQGGKQEGQQQQGEQQQGEQRQGKQDPAAGAQADEEDGDGSDGGEQEQPDGGSKQYQKALRVVCSAVLSLAVAPDGCTVAAAIEGQQEVLLLKLDAAAGGLELVQRLALQGLANPAAVAFDGAGRLWVVGGLLLLSTESAHVGVAVKQGDAWADATAEVLPGELRGFLECRVEGEEQQQQANYYHEGLKRKVYSYEETKQREERKRRRRDEIEKERLAELREREEREEERQAYLQALQDARDGFDDFEGVQMLKNVGEL